MNKKISKEQKSEILYNYFTLNNFNIKSISEIVKINEVTVNEIITNHLSIQFERKERIYESKMNF